MICESDSDAEWGALQMTETCHPSSPSNQVQWHLSIATAILWMCTCSCGAPCPIRYDAPFISLPWRSVLTPSLTPGRGTPLDLSRFLKSKNIIQVPTFELALFLSEGCLRADDEHPRLRYHWCGLKWSVFWPNFSSQRHLFRRAPQF